MAFWTFLLTLCLEVWSLDTVKNVLKQKGGGLPLYGAAIFSNLRNHFLFGIPIYTVAAYLFCCDDNDEVTLTSSERLTSIASILFVQSVCFYTAHRAFHSNPNWYKYHRFHHRFNTNVPPMAANAVSPVEYVFAYILPFTLTLPILHVDTLSLRIALSIVSVSNLMIHTPKLSAVSERLLPVWIVSTDDHLEHHRKLNTKYAAPTFNVDYLVDWIEERYFQKQEETNDDSTSSPDPKKPQDTSTSHKRLENTHKNDTLKFH